VAKQEHSIIQARVFTRARARGNARYRLARAEAEPFSRLTGECATVRARFSRFPKMLHSQKRAKPRRYASCITVAHRRLFMKRVNARARAHVPSTVSSYFFRRVSSLPSASFRFVAEKYVALFYLGTYHSRLRFA